MIDITMREGALDRRQVEQLVREVTDVVSYWIGVEKTEAGRQSVWVFVHYLGKGDQFIGGACPKRPHYRVEIRALQGGLEQPTVTGGLIRDLTRVFLNTEGAPLDFENADRVWFLFQELLPGYWGRFGSIYYRRGYISSFDVPLTQSMKSDSDH